MNVEHCLATLPGLFWICLSVPVLFAIASIYIARKLIEPHKRNPHHDIAHAILGPVATIFGILGAFIVATVWHKYDDTSLNLHEESNALRSLYFDAEAFSPEYSKQIQKLCKNYRDAVIKNEWKIVQQSKDTVEADDFIGQLSKIFLIYPINSAKESIYFKQSIDNLTKLRKYRELRIEDSCTGLLPLLWILFLLGGTTLVLVSLLMISSPVKTHAAMVVLLAMLIGIMTFAIISLDFPFSGFTKMSTIPFENIPMDPSL